MSEQNIQITTDSILFRQQHDTLEVLLVKRKADPYKGMWSVPGGFVNHGEDLIDSARRELQEETSLQVSSLKQLYTMGAPGRDPRGHTVSVCYYAVLSGSDDTEARAGDDAEEVRWWDVRELPQLGFDHADELQLAFRQQKIKSILDKLGIQVSPTAGQ